MESGHTIPQQDNTKYTWSYDKGTNDDAASNAVGDGIGARASL